jgi:hypothetical protein
MLTTTWWCAYQQKRADFTGQIAEITYIGNSTITRVAPTFIYPHEANHP